MSSSQINTFVIIDLETTGLPYAELNRTKITEIALVAATREHISDACKQFVSLPRVLQKLNFCVNPFRMIHPVSTEITGLYNELLEKEKPFDENLCGLLNGFLERLTPPICILAHNGMKFDFPILQSELNRCGKTLLDHVLCADSLVGFRELLGKDLARSNGTSVPAAGKRCESNVAALPKPVFNGEALNSLNETSNSFIFKIDTRLGTSPSKTSMMEHDDCDGMLKKTVQDMQKCNETTPGRQKVVLPSLAPDNVRKTERNVIQHGKFARKRLFPSECDNTVSSPKSFKLVDVYEFLHKKTAVDSHRAESDVLFLLQCVVAMGSEFIHWADTNATKFNLVKKMW